MNDAIRPTETIRLESGRERDPAINVGFANDFGRPDCVVLLAPSEETKGPSRWLLFTPSQAAGLRDWLNSALPSSSAGARKNHLLAGEAFVAEFKREPSSPSDCAWMNGYDAAQSSGEPSVEPAQGSKDWHDEQALSHSLDCSTWKQLRQLVDEKRHALRTEQEMHAAWRKRATEAEAELQALKSSGEPGAIQGWQPIETAPKMRKIMVHYLNDLGKHRVVLACYYVANSLEMHDDYQDVGTFDEATGTSYAEAGWYEEHDSDSPVLALAGEPDRWMPLPEPPSSTLTKVDNHE